MRFSLATILCTICTNGNVGPGARLWLSKLERAKRWASERAAIKAEVNQAKETVDLLRIAHAITRLDALDAEIEAVKKAESGKSRKTKTSFRATRSMRVNSALRLQSALMGVRAEREPALVGSALLSVGPDLHSGPTRSVVGRDARHMLRRRR